MHITGFCSIFFAFRGSLDALVKIHGRGDVTRDNVILTILYDEANAILREIAYEFEK